jgi:hypothetical protein
MCVSTYVFVSVCVSVSVFVYVCMCVSFCMSVCWVYVCEHVCEYGGCLCGTVSVCEWVCELCTFQFLPVYYSQHNAPDLCRDSIGKQI